MASDAGSADRPTPTDSTANSVYFGFWHPEFNDGWHLPKERGFEAMRKDFGPDNRSWRNGDGGAVPDDINVLFAIYHDPWGYSGQAFVIFEQDGKLLFVGGGHCSCYGLEGQWEPDEVTPKQLTHMLCEGTKFDDLEEDAWLALAKVLCKLKKDRRWR